MNTCSKCGAALRQPNATFCHACGAAQKPDAPNTTAGKAWQTRLRAGDSAPAVWRLLWILTGPLAVILFPLHLRAATLRLRRHVRQRLETPVFLTPRFKDAEEGRQIVRRLAASGRGWGSLGSLAAFLLALILTGVLFLSPLSSPLSYEKALDGVLGGGYRDSRFVYITSPAEYDAAWQRYGNLGSHTSISVDAWQKSSTPSMYEKGPVPPVWDGLPNDTLSNHRPFEYVPPERSDWKGPRPIFRVQGLYVFTHYDRTAYSIILWVGMAVLYLAYLVLGVQFWRQFGRHVGTEALAAAYARSDTSLLDKLIPGVKARNAIMVVLGIIMAVTLLQLLIFPFVAALVFAGHERWEQKSGVADALGL